MFNRQNFNRGKFNTSASQLTVSGTASLVLTGGVKGNLSFFAPLSTVNFNLNTYGKQSALLYAPISSATLQLESAGQGLRRFFSGVSSVEMSIGLSGEMLCVIFAPNTTADLRLDSNGHSLRRYFTDAPKTMTVLGLAGQGSRTIYTNLSPVEFNQSLCGESLRRFLTATPIVPINLGAKGMAAMFGYSTIELPRLVVPPNGDLVIDTEEMTVTLNGEDVTRYFGSDSEFFKLKPGENIVIYEDSVQNRNISYKILWKDLWL